MIRPASRPFWAVAPAAAIARETGLSTREARRALRPMHARRRLALIVAITLAFTAGAGGWLAFVEAVSTLYQQVTTFNPDGSVASTESTGPFGITVYPLLASAILGFGLAWLIGTAAAFAAQYAVVGREARRCIRMPACLACGYDLSAVVGDACPECGTQRPARIVIA